MSYATIATKQVNSLHVVKEIVYDAFGNILNNSARIGKNRGHKNRGQVMPMLSFLSLYFLKGAEHAAQTPYGTTR